MLVFVFVYLWLLPHPGRKGHWSYGCRKKNWIDCEIVLCALCLYLCLQTQTITAASYPITGHARVKGALIALALSLIQMPSWPVVIITCICVILFLYFVFLYLSLYCLITYSHATMTCRYHYCYPVITALRVSAWDSNPALPHKSLILSQTAFSNGQRAQSSYLSHISQITFVEKKLSRGEILGDFATIFALSCGEKLSPKIKFVEKKWLL